MIIKRELLTIFHTFHFNTNSTGGPIPVPTSKANKSSPRGEEEKKEARWGRGVFCSAWLPSSWGRGSQRAWVSRKIGWEMNKSKTTFEAKTSHMGKGSPERDKLREWDIVKGRESGLELSYPHRAKSLLPLILIYFSRFAGESWRLKANSSSTHTCTHRGH